MPSSVLLDGVKQTFVSELASKLRDVASPDGLIVRSSVIGESIWDRGKYKSLVVPLTMDIATDLKTKIELVLESAEGRNAGVVIQRYVPPKSFGEFGNLLRISKTRDHWELSATAIQGNTTRRRFNTQRDEAASPEAELLASRQPNTRLFGSVAAWLNNALLRGYAHRVNCEWISDNKAIYLVQLDGEDEDFSGVNPYQIRIPATHAASSRHGTYFRRAEGEALNKWDKLKVLDELWEPDQSKRPALFYAEANLLPKLSDGAAQADLEKDFEELIGPNNIIVRTSVGSGSKPPNLPRTEGLSPASAAVWCLEQVELMAREGIDLSNIAFVAHRFIAARACAWVRADPNNASVEIHSLWGLPDALQYCPYDIWEVHTSINAVTEYPEYKSNILISREDGNWEYVRVKNELARNLSIGRVDAIELASRTAAIAQRLNQSCHVMWFVGCKEQDGSQFNVPWYWTEAHESDENSDRANYSVTRIESREDLEQYQQLEGNRFRQALELMPTDLALMRDVKFIDQVAHVANEAQVPVILAGSTLAHAYFQLRRHGCTVVSRTRKDHTRVRQSVHFGKLVRDKIPSRIAHRQETEITQEMPKNLVSGFLVSKLVEEALEVRNAEGTEQKTAELADLLEVLRALANHAGISFESVTSAADAKKGKAGGFEKGLVLLQTAILGRSRKEIPRSKRALAQVLGRRVDSETFEIPFSYFGFMEMDEGRSVSFEDFGIRLVLRLKTDRIEIKISRGLEQGELPLDRTVRHKSS